jgi:F-box and WD-40 domain protein 1/11
MRDDDIKDNESGVDMTCASPIVRADSVTEKKMSKLDSGIGQTNHTNPVTVDPFQRLPAELATTVLSNLDAASLVRAERVSRSWHEHASSPHVWRTVFLRKYEPEVHVSPAPIQMGGLGIGKMAGGNPAPAQDWKKMFEARGTLDKRWKAGTPAAVYLNGHTDSVYCCQFDEHKAITGSRDRTIRVWDLKTYKCLKVYGGPNHRPTANTPPPMEERPERVISYASLNGTKVGNDIYTVPSDYHDASILCLQYDSEIMVTGSSDYTCIVWDITGDEYVPMYRLRGHEAGVLDVCLDDKYIISCSKDAMIKVWDRKTGNCIRTLKGHRGPVNAVQLRGNYLVSASGDALAKLWNLETGVAIKDFPSEDRGLAAVEFSDDAKYVLAGGNDHVVYKFDASTGELVHSRVKHDGLVRSLFLDAFNGRIVSGSYDQSIQVSDYDTGVTYATYKNWTTSWILSAKSDYRRVVATSQDGRTLILDFGHNVPGADLLTGSK